MPGDLFQHMIEEAQAGDDIRLAAAIHIQLILSAFHWYSAHGSPGAGRAS